jgi:hypothetical protein
MRQPIIDPDKVSAWAGSVRGVFAYDQFGTWLAIGITLTVLLMVVVTAWVASRHGKSAIDDLDRLIHS